MQVITIHVQHSHDKSFCLEKVESCDWVDEESECSDASVQGERMQQALSVAGNSSE